MTSFEGRQTLAQMYILTDRLGFTTACDATCECALREAGRVVLAAPIVIHHWARVNGKSKHAGWKLLNQFLWDGGTRWP